MDTKKPAKWYSFPAVFFSPTSQYSSTPESRENTKKILAKADDTIRNSATLRKQGKARIEESQRVLEEMSSEIDAFTAIRKGHMI